MRGCSCIMPESKFIINNGLLLWLIRVKAKLNLRQLKVRVVSIMFARSDLWPKELAKKAGHHNVLPV